MPAPGAPPPTPGPALDPWQSPLARAALASQARGHLRSLGARQEGIRAMAVVTFDGLLLASELADGVGAERLGAMCASLLALATRTSEEVAGGELRQVILDGARGPMLLSRAGALGVLAVAADRSAHLGRLMLEARATAQALAALYAGARV